MDSFKDKQEPWLRADFILSSVTFMISLDFLVVIKPCRAERAALMATFGLLSIHGTIDIIYFLTVQIESYPASFASAD